MNCDDAMEVKILVQGAPGGSGRFPVMSDRQRAHSELCCETLRSGNVLIEFKNRRKHFMNTRNQKEINFQELVDIKDVVIDSSLDK